MRKLYFSPQKNNNKTNKQTNKQNDRIISLAWNSVYWLLRSSCFEFFRDRKYGLFWAKRLMEIWYLLIIEKFLFLTFRKWEIRFFSAKNWWKDDNYGLLKSSCFTFFDDGKYGLFISEKNDLKIIFTWSFWAFHDIPGPGKYGFSCSEQTGLVFA